MHLTLQNPNILPTRIKSLLSNLNLVKWPYYFFTAKGVQNFTTASEFDCSNALQISKFVLNIDMLSVIYLLNVLDYSRFTAIFTYRLYANLFKVIGERRSRTQINGHHSG